MKLLTALFLLCCASPAYALTGHVYRIVDGDTFWMTVAPQGQAPQKVKVRLFCADSPERGQPGYSEAKAALKDLVRFRTVELAPPDSGEATNRDRMVYRVTVDGSDVGALMVRLGHAWDDPKFCDDYEGYQGQARSEGRGIWSSNNPTPPWIWRPLNK